MFKRREVPVLQDKLYALYDKVADRYTHFGFFPNDAVYVREMVSHRMSFPLNFEDTQCVEVLSYNSLDGFTVRPIEWTVWHTPDNVSALLKPLGVTQAEIDEIAARSDENMKKFSSEIAKHVKVGE